MGKNFDVPQGGNQQEIMDRISELERRIHDAKLLIDQTRVKLRDYLREIQKVS